MFSPTTSKSVTLTPCGRLIRRFVVFVKEEDFGVKYLATIASTADNDLVEFKPEEQYNFF